MKKKNLEKNPFDVMYNPGANLVIGTTWRRVSNGKFLTVVDFREPTSEHSPYDASANRVVFDDKTWAYSDDMGAFAGKFVYFGHCRKDTTNNVKKKVPKENYVTRCDVQKENEALKKKIAELEKIEAHRDNLLDEKIQLEEILIEIENLLKNRFDEQFR